MLRERQRVLGVVLLVVAASLWSRPQPLIRVMRVLDPVTQQLMAYTIAGGWGRAGTASPPAGGKTVSSP